MNRYEKPKLPHNCVRFGVTDSKFQQGVLTMQTSQFLRLVTVIVAISFIAGCASMARGVGTLTSNKYAEARSGTVWVVPPPQLEPLSSSDRTVYISYRNLSDAQDIDLRALLRDSAQQQGWTLVNDPQKAKFRLRASLRFFGEVEPESGGAAAASKFGNIAGAAIGVGTGIGITKGTGSLAGGAIGGGLVGGLVATGLSNASRPREYAAIVDFLLEQYSAKSVTFELSTGSGSDATDSAGSGNARMGSGGSTSRGNSSSATAQRTSHYFPHGVRLSAWANQMAMKESEALPLVKSRIERVVTQLLPM